jgi:hypothetical protein
MKRMKNDITAFQRHIDKANIKFNFKFDYSKAVYLGDSEKIWIICPDHGGSWQNTRCHANSKYGCLKCSGQYPIDNKSVDERLIDRNIRRIGDVKGTNNKIEWGCNVEGCGYIWFAASDTILNAGNGCNRCGGREPLNNKSVDNRLIGRNIRRISNINGNKNNIQWLCEIEGCGYIWTATPDDILNHGSGCIKCSNHIRHDNNTVDIRLIDRNIERIGDANGAFNNVEWLCLTCRNMWVATPANVLNHVQGCPQCNIAGINELSVRSFLNENDIAHEYQIKIYKIGNCDNKRLSFDFYFPILKLVIEYQGHQHYAPEQFGGITKERADVNFVDQQRRDTYKRQFCKDNDIELIEVDGRKYHANKLIKYLNEELLPILKEKQKAA